MSANSLSNAQSGAAGPRLVLGLCVRSHHERQHAEVAVDRGMNTRGNVWH